MLQWTSPRDPERQQVRPRQTARTTGVAAPTRRVAILGSGLPQLALAYALCKRGLAVRVLESECGDALAARFLPDGPLAGTVPLDCFHVPIGARDTAVSSLLAELGLSHRLEWQSSGLDVRGSRRDLARARARRDVSLDLLLSRRGLRPGMGEVRLGWLRGGLAALESALRGALAAAGVEGSIGREIDEIDVMGPEPRLVVGRRSMRFAALAVTPGAGDDGGARERLTSVVVRGWRRPTGGYATLCLEADADFEWILDTARLDDPQGAEAVYLTRRSAAGVWLEPDDVVGKQALDTLARLGWARDPSTAPSLHVFRARIEAAGACEPTESPRLRVFSGLHSRSQARGSALETLVIRARETAERIERALNQS